MKHVIYTSYISHNHITHETLHDMTEADCMICSVTVKTLSKVSHALLTVLAMKMYQLNAA